MPLSDGTHDISYVMTSLARGKVTGTTSCRGTVFNGGGNGIEATAAIIGDGVDGGGGNDGGFNSYCGAGAQSGDPFPPIARGLPEPGSLPLVALAVGLLPVLSSRRFRKQAF